MPFTAFAATPALPIPWLPADNGYLSAVCDPSYIDSTSVLTAGTLYLVKVKARASLTVGTLHFSINAAGSGASTGSFAGLYSSAGTLLSGSADIGAALLGTGDLSVPLSTPGQVIAAGGFGWAALLVNLATTQPTMNRLTGSIATGANLGLAAAALQFATNGTGLTTLPASITPASNTSANAISLWASAA